MFIRNLKDDDDDDISYESTTENKPKYIGPALKL